MSRFSPIRACDQIRDEPDLLSPWTKFLRCEVWNIEPEPLRGGNTTQDKTQFYQCVTQTLTVDPSENKKQQLDTPSPLDGSQTGSQFGSWRVGNWAEPSQKNSNENGVEVIECYQASHFSIIHQSCLPASVPQSLPTHPTCRKPFIFWHIVFLKVQN